MNQVIKLFLGTDIVIQHKMELGKKAVSIYASNKVLK